jgi:hypothetical protein
MSDNSNHEILTDFLMWRSTLQNYRRLWLLNCMTDDEFAQRLEVMGFRGYEIKAEMMHVRAEEKQPVKSPIIQPAKAPVTKTAEDFIDLFEIDSVVEENIKQEK